MDIERDRLEKFLREHATNVVDFLRVAVNNPSEFFKQAKDLLLPGNSEKMIVRPKIVLLHGSRNRQRILKPSVSSGGSNKNKNETLIYATNNPNYAIFLAVIDLQESGEASVVVEDAVAHLSISKGFVNGESRLASGYVHLVEGSSFQKIDTHGLTAVVLTTAGQAALVPHHPRLAV